MSKASKSKKGSHSVRRISPPQPAYSPEAVELRELLERDPNGFHGLIPTFAEQDPDRLEAVMTELMRGMGKEVLPFLRAAALGNNEAVSLAALRVLPLFGTRAAADVLAEVCQAYPDDERTVQLGISARSLAARGIRVAVPDSLLSVAPVQRMTLREFRVTPPDSVGTRSIFVRLQDGLGVSHGIVMVWNDRAGVKDGFLLPMSRGEWEHFARAVMPDGSLPPTCPPDYARWLVAEARKVNRLTGFPLEDHLDAWDQWVGAPPEGYTPPDPMERLLEAHPDEVATWVEQGALLFLRPDVEHWFLEAGDCAAYMPRFTQLQAQASRTHAPADVRKIKTFVSEVAIQMLTEELRRLLVVRLLELSRVCEWLGQHDDACRAAASANVLGVARSFFFEGLVDRTLIAALGLTLEGDDLNHGRYDPMSRIE